MVSTKDLELMDEIMELNKKRFIPKRREFTKKEQELFDMMLDSLKDEEQEKILKYLDETPDYNLAQ
tara:strand:+ start:1825 stop:2022 length:198 start_codon:yes stop_codon:yes gene_type:complete